LTLTPGLRFEPFVIDGSRTSPQFADQPAMGFERMVVVSPHFPRWLGPLSRGATALGPRLSAAYPLPRRFTTTLAGGIYTQPPDPEDLSAVFGNPTLGLSSAVHLSLGASYKLTGTLTFEVVGFAK